MTEPIFFTLTKVNIAKFWHLAMILFCNRQWEKSLPFGYTPLKGNFFTLCRIKEWQFNIPQGARGILRNDALLTCFIVFFTENQHCHWACWQYCQSGGTQEWRNVGERAILAVVYIQQLKALSGSSSRIRWWVSTVEERGTIGSLTLAQLDPWTFWHNWIPGTIRSLDSLAQLDPCSIGSLDLLAQ